MLVQEAVGEIDLVNLASPSVVFMSTDKNSGLRLSWHSSNSQGLLNDKLVLHVYLKRHQIKGFSKPVHNHLTNVLVSYKIPKKITNSSHLLNSRCSMGAHICNL